MEDSDECQSAEKRVEAKMCFYTRLPVCTAAILLLAVSNFASSSGTIGFHWPTLSLVVAVAIQAAFVSVFSGRVIVAEQMIERQMGKARARSAAMLFAPGRYNP